jgi:uncharacterized membrane protein YeaQ/YmgE (transglycosylase-associated protein family)
MSPEIIAIIVGLLVGWVADFCVKERGYGMIADLGLGLGGGLLAVIFVQAVGLGADAGWFVMALVSLVGAAGCIGAQRRFWTRPGSPPARPVRL